MRPPLGPKPSRRSHARATSGRLLRRRVAGFYSAVDTFDVFNPIVEQFPFLIVPRWVMVLLLGTGLALLWWGFRRLERVTPVPRPPQAIAEWLAGEGKTETFSYWAQCYWPLAKLYAYRRTWFGFTWWRRMPRLRVRDRWTVEQSRPPGCYFDE